MDPDRPQRTDIPAATVRGWIWKAMILGAIVGAVGTYLYLHYRG
ncbi:MAG TPA: hypothetical protein VFQ45_01240 [Longimicrobium sp.]|nr:hypothetical protein [Longimicrobium sp.]